MTKRPTEQEAREEMEKILQHQLERQIVLTENLTGFTPTNIDIHENDGNVEAPAMRKEPEGY